MPQEKVIQWEEDFPSGIGHTSIDFIRNHGNRELFIQAKAGDEVAAVELVRKCIKKDKISSLRNQYPDAVILPVLAKERTGYNVIPLAYTKVMSSISGLEINEEVYQINSSHHTGACAVSKDFLTVLCLTVLCRRDIITSYLMMWLHKVERYPA